MELVVVGASWGGLHAVSALLDSLPDALDHTRFSSTVSGVAHPLSPPPSFDAAFWSRLCASSPFPHFLAIIAISTSGRATASFSIGAIPRASIAQQVNRSRPSARRTTKGVGDVENG